MTAAATRPAADKAASQQVVPDMAAAEAAARPVVEMRDPEPEPARDR
jgi:hypothetical protein